MSNPWFRLYHEFADDPKVQMMPEHMQRRLIMLFCEQCSDVLATFSEREIAFHWRVSDAEVAETKALFIAKGFIDDHWKIVNWDHRQFISDSSTERTRRYRERRRTSPNSHGDANVTKCDAIEQNRTDSEQNRTEQNRRAHVERSEEPDSEDRKDLVGSVGEGLEKQGKDKSSLQPEGEESEKEITPSCAISSNSTHLPDTETLQIADSKDESGYTSVPSIDQQPRLEPPTEEKAGENQPSAVISWPAVGMQRDEFVLLICKSHALPDPGGYAQCETNDAINRLWKEGVCASEHEAACYLYERVKAYAAAVAKWPKQDQRFKVGVVKFMNSEVYRQDDSEWDRSTGEGNSTLLDAIIQNVLVEGRSTEPGGGAPTPILDAENIRRKREIARASSLGPRPGFAHRRAF